MYRRLLFGSAAMVFCLLGKAGCYAQKEPPQVTETKQLPVTTGDAIPSASEETFAYRRMHLATLAFKQNKVLLDEIITLYPNTQSAIKARKMRAFLEQYPLD
jgi:hypothetical protein